ncbi:hypothetical protein [Actinomadura roseirufa]|uniref:hypothetical protein n=1 Tax=Actinomadura roseirufa TaxID=2094049 RepID=UPI001041687C|nr:hypothetical protein [Actinomadura roseirufa]
MSSLVKRSINRLTVSLLAMGAVFGLAVLMIFKGYDPAVITTVVTGTSFAAAELVRRLQMSPTVPTEPDQTAVLDGTATPDRASSPEHTPGTQS